MNLTKASTPMVNMDTNREPPTVIAYSYTARYLGSQRAATLPCLIQRVEHFAVFRVLYYLLELAFTTKSKADAI